jgi:hypothetical protein
MCVKKKGYSCPGPGYRTPHKKCETSGKESGLSSRRYQEGGVVWFREVEETVE